MMPRNTNAPLDGRRGVTVEYDQDEGTPSIHYFLGVRHPAGSWKVLSPPPLRSSTSTSPAIHQPSTALGRCEQSVVWEGTGVTAHTRRQQGCSGFHTPDCYPRVGLIGVMLGAKDGFGRATCRWPPAPGSEAMETNRQRYEEYIASPAWGEKRRRYFASKLPQGCVVCGADRVQLHHRTYRRLGREKLQDLVPLCQPCHSAGHDLARRLEAAGMVGRTRSGRRRGAKPIYRIAKRLLRIKAGLVPVSELPVGWKAPASWGLPSRQPVPKAERWQDVLRWPV